MKKMMMLLVFVLPALFLLAVYGRSEEEESQNRVVVIAIDGLRWQELYQGARRDSLMPFVWQMGRNQGTMLGNRNRKSNMEVANGIWKSYAGYSEMLCGTTDDQHIHDNRKQQNPNRSVLEMVVASPEYRGSVRAVASWDVIPYILGVQRSHLPVDWRSSHRVSKQVRCDSVTAHNALNVLKNEHPKLLFVEFCETDYYGHNGKWKGYLDAAHRNDLFIRQLWQYCQKDEFYRGKTTFLITCDHGRGESLGAHYNRGEVDSTASWTEHNNHIKGSNQTWLVAFGNSVQHLGEVEGGRTIYTKQVAPTVARILHVPFSTGKDEKPAQPIYSILKKNI